MPREHSLWDSFVNGRKIPYAKWQAHIASNDTADIISVRNLQVTVDAGNDAWGRKKSQPCLVTVKIHLAKPFLTAAQADALDASTVHYGILSKGIRSAIEARKGSFDNTNVMMVCVMGAIEEATNDTELSAFEVDVFYPKGSLLGDGSGALLYGSKHAEGVDFGLGVYLKNLRIPCIIGVNANERQQKQPVVVSFQLDHHSILDNQYKLERDIVAIISESSFETLEALTGEVLYEIARRHSLNNTNTSVTLRVEKPMAVPFADAPVIEVRRQL